MSLKYKYVKCWQLCQKSCFHSAIDLPAAHYVEERYLDRQKSLLEIHQKSRLSLYHLLFGFAARISDGITQSSHLLRRTEKVGIKPQKNTLHSQPEKPAYLKDERTSKDIWQKASQYRYTDVLIRMDNS